MPKLIVLVPAERLSPRAAYAFTAINLAVQGGLVRIGA